MTGISGRLDAEWDAAKAELARMVHHGQPSPTFTPAEQSQPSQPEVPVSVLATIHKDLSSAGSAIQHAWPQLTAIVTNPVLDELIDVALSAAGAGVAAETFQASIDAFKGATARKAGTADQVAAAVDAGQQAAQQPAARAVV